MGSPLPVIPQAEFEQRLSASGPDVGVPALRPGWPGLLWQHYEEMRRWNPKLSLVGPGTAGEVVERHYAESLRALPLLGDPGTGAPPRRLVDVGTGAGFPGLVLAVASAELEVVLVEANQRKCAFLNAALRRLRRAVEEVPGGAPGTLSCRVLGARVERPEDAISGWPESVDVVTSRAVAWTSDLHQSLQSRWPTVRFLLWIGRELPPLPAATAGRQVSLGSGRRIVEILGEPPRLP